MRRVREREEKKKKNKKEDKTSANVFLNGFNYSLTSTPPRLKNISSSKLRKKKIKRVQIFS